MLTNPPAAWSRRQSLAAIASLSWCVAPVLLLALEWGVACLALGHPPVPMADDPKFISPFSSLLHFVTGVSMLSMLGIPLILPVLWLRVPARTPQSVVIAIGCLVLPVASLFILRSDPLEIIEWWFD